MLNAFIDFLFPNTCLECEIILAKNQDLFCVHCMQNLPFTSWGFDTKNPMYKKLNAYSDIENASGYLYFNQDSSTKKLLHQLKYKGKQNIGRELAYGIIDAMGKENFSKIDGIIPIPIHPKKMRSRGYHQNTIFGKTLSQVLNKPYFEEGLYRKIHQKSQSLMNKRERLERLNGSFEIGKIPLQNAHILLIDDVCTTGATLTYCAQILNRHKYKVSVLTMAYVP